MAWEPGQPQEVYQKGVELMSGHPRVRDYPEALVRILITIMERTPEGGATMEDLKTAYQEARGNYPCDKTVQRAIKRLNTIFNPLLANGAEEDEEENGKDGAAPGRDSLVNDHPSLQPVRTESGTRYVFSGELPGSIMDANQALLITLGLYSQHKGMLKGHFETVISALLRDLMSRSEEFPQLLEELQQHVFISGYGPADPAQSLCRIKRILRAIRWRQCLRLRYLRSYDGELTRREVEPYGLICRFEKWYLVAFCLQQQQRRVFLLDHIQEMQVLEARTFTWPEDFSLQQDYGASWGVWTEEQESEPETVRLQVVQGLAKRFERVCFHESQCTEALADGGARVTFTVKGAQEMVPWLMSWGDAVKLLEPAWLREELARRLGTALELYC